MGGLNKTFVEEEGISGMSNTGVGKRAPAIDTARSMARAKATASCVAVESTAVEPLAFTCFGDMGMRMSMKLKARFKQVRTLQRRQSTAVYLTIDVVDNTPAVVKVLDTRKANPQADAALCVYSALARQPHPNLMSAKAMVSDGDQLSIVLPYIRGGDLVTQISGQGAKSLKSSLFVCKQLLCGLRHLHRLGFAHLDLSPENILVDSREHAAIIDYGYCTDIKGPIRIVGGKPQYMAPEHLKCMYPQHRCPSVKGTEGVFPGQAQMGNLSASDPTKADVFALGCIVFIVLFGYPPWKMALRTDTAFDFVQHFGTEMLLEEWGMAEHFSTYPRSIFSLLDSMLLEDPVRRISVDKALEHPWVMSCNHRSTSVATARGA